MKVQDYGAKNGDAKQALWRSLIAFGHLPDPRMIRRQDKRTACDEP
ncbi:MAG: hypothetical protein J6I76_15040 [Oribacterium sp.]|nr:hypothetical protein [Oribacterium sp.]